MRSVTKLTTEDRGVPRGYGKGRGYIVLMRVVDLS